MGGSRRSRGVYIMDRMEKKAHVKRQREVRIHAELWHTSDFLLEAGQLRAEGAAHQFRASLIFRAFFLEAFSQLARTQIDTTLEVPGASTLGNPFCHAMENLYVERALRDV
jgi:hypothetical protein